MSEIEILFKELAELKAALWYDFWDLASFIALMAVFVGVVGESVVELTDWIKDPFRKGWVHKASALILIAGLGGELATYQKNSANNGIIFNFLAKKTVEAKERVVALEVKYGERVPKVEKKVDTLQQDVKKSADNQYPKDIDLGVLQRATAGIRGNLRNVTLIRLNDPIAGKYATNLGTALTKLKPKFAVSFIDLPSSRFSGVIVCEKGSEDVALGLALKRADIVSEIKKMSAEECSQPIPPVVVTGILGKEVAVPNLPSHGTLIFVGHRRPPPRSN